MFNVVSSTLCYETLLEIIVFPFDSFAVRSSRTLDFFEVNILSSAIIDLKTDVCLSHHMTTGTLHQMRCDGTVCTLDGCLYFSHSTFDKSRHLFPKLSLIKYTVWFH